MRPSRYDCSTAEIGFPEPLGPRLLVRWTYGRPGSLRDSQADSFWKRSRYLKGTPDFFQGAQGIGVQRALGGGGAKRRPDKHGDGRENSSRDK